MTGSRGSPGAPRRLPFGPRWADAAWIVTWVAVAGALIVRNVVLRSSELPTLGIGPLQLNSFGPLVLLNFLFGWHLVRSWYRRFGLDWEGFKDDLVWIVLAGFFCSHLVSVALYDPGQLADARVLLDFRTGISSFGGIYSGALFAVLALRNRGLPVWPHMDGLVYGFVGGYMFGRAGCFSVHDHPGVETDFFLAVEIDGVLRHDLGFYEMLLVAVLLGMLTLISKKDPLPAGLPTAAAAALYSPVRFYLDHLRTEDPRYAGLTPGQWFCLATLGIAVWAWREASRPPPPLPPGT